MILEVMDHGRFEKIAVVNGSAGKDIDGRAYIGGHRLNSSGYESVWNVETLPQAGWNYRVSSHSKGGLMDEKQETEKQTDDLLPYPQDLVQKLNEIEVERAKSPAAYSIRKVGIMAPADPIILTRSY